MSRPSSFSQEMVDRICARIADGESVRSICRDEEMPAASTVFLWLSQHDSFAEQYARAKESGIDALAEDLLDITDDARNDWMERNGKDSPGWVLNGEHVQRSKLRVDTRKWILSKLAPKKYGDRVAVAGDPDAPMVFERIVREVVDPKQ